MPGRGLMDRCRYYKIIRPISHIYFLMFHLPSHDDPGKVGLCDDGLYDRGLQGTRPTAIDRHAEVLTREMRARRQ